MPTSPPDHQPVIFRGSLTDEEIGLVKAMLSRGMANDHIHFYFNRADRLISSGRIAQIKKGKYGTSVAESSVSEVEAFIELWQARQGSAWQKGLTSPGDDGVLRAMFSHVSTGWIMRLGETDHVECKLNFRIAPEYRFADVIKAIAGLANNKGGHIIFGVRDGSFAVEGMADSAFDDIDPAAINRTLVGVLDPVPRVIKATLSVGGHSLGVLHVERHDHAPIIALKNVANDVREGGIYYRYVGETRLIKPGELRQILANREQRAIADFSRRMALVATGAAATLDMESGEVRGPAGRFLIDKNLLKDIQFIREGEFAEVKGAPTLRLIGEVEPVSEIERERVRIIRRNITPDSVVRNFLKGERVAEPMQYIHSQAHTQRKWQPIWYYAEEAKIPAEQIASELKAAIATTPSSRNLLVDRLSRRVTAHKLHPGKPLDWLRDIAQGKAIVPTTPAQDMTFALAVQGLRDGATTANELKGLLLAMLDRAQGHDPQSSNRRSAIYRAACRLDEILHGNVKSG